MAVPISQFRKEIFSFAESALAGNVVVFVHKGIRFKVVPENAPDKLANVTPMQVINPEYDLEAASADLLKEMQAEWEQDWIPMRRSPLFAPCSLMSWPTS